MENHLLLSLVEKESSLFPVVVMSQAEKWQDGASPVPPTPKNSPRGLRLVYTSPKRGIVYHIKKLSGKLTSMSLAALRLSLYLHESVYCLTKAHATDRTAGRASKGRKHRCVYVGLGFSFQFYILLPLPSFPVSLPLYTHRLMKQRCSKNNNQKEAKVVKNTAVFKFFKDDFSFSVRSVFIMNVIKTTR